MPSLRAALRRSCRRTANSVARGRHEVRGRKTSASCHVVRFRGEGGQAFKKRQARTSSKTSGGASKRPIAPQRYSESSAPEAAHAPAVAKSAESRRGDGPKEREERRGT